MKTEPSGMPAGALSVALDERDTPTQAHCTRVSVVCRDLGRACALSAHDIHLLELASVLHDIGKIGIPDDVLKKTGRFTADDWLIMQTHSARGERIVLASHLDEADVLATTIRHHHERFDGRGYPDGLAGEAIPVMSRIVAIADAYDAMARIRMYGQARTHEAIMAELRDHQGRQHDPYVLTKFAAVIEHSPFKAAG